MLASPLVPEQPLALLSTLNISSTNLMRTSCDVASAFSLAGEGETNLPRELSNYTPAVTSPESQSQSLSPQHQLAEHLSPLVRLHMRKPLHNAILPLHDIEVRIVVRADLPGDGAVIPEPSLFGAVKVIVDHHHLALRELTSHNTQNDVMHILTHTNSMRVMM